MKSHRTLWPVLVMVSLVVCCCCAITAIIAGSTINRSMDWKNLRRSDLEALGTGAEVTSQIARSVSVTGTAPVKLVVDVPIGNITVKADGGNQIALQATKRAWGWNRSQAEAVLNGITINFEPSGNQVRISASGLTDMENLPRSPQVDTSISVPEETEVQLVSNVGRIFIAGTRADVDIRADVGQIVLQDVAPSETLQVETRVGTIELGGRLADPAKYRLTSDVGWIALRLPPDSTFNIDAKSDIGSVGVEFPLIGRNSRQGFVGEEARGYVGANPTAALYLRSRVGSISVGPSR